MGPEGLADLDHLEVRLTHAALGADEIFRDILPGRARGDAFFFAAEGFIVDPAAHNALPLFQGGLLGQARDSCPGAARTLAEVAGKSMDWGGD